MKPPGSRGWSPLRLSACCCKLFVKCLRCGSRRQGRGIVWKRCDRPLCAPYLRPCTFFTFHVSCAPTRGVCSHWRHATTRARCRTGRPHAAVARRAYLRSGPLYRRREALPKCPSAPWLVQLSRTPLCCIHGSRGGRRACYGCRSRASSSCAARAPAPHCRTELDAINGRATCGVDMTVRDGCAQSDWCMRTCAVNVPSADFCCSRFTANINTQLRDARPARMARERT